MASLIGKTIGHGTYAIVNEAVLNDSKEAYRINAEISTSEPIALKIINKKFMSGIHKSRLIEQEISILKIVSSPDWLESHRNANIVALRDCFEDDDNVYLAMDLCTGGDLFDRIRSRDTFYEEDAAQAIHSVLQSLNYLHSNGVVHRDIKPENLLFQSTESQRILLTDFGLSKILSPDYIPVCGTMSYMAPEVLENQLHTGKPSDLWSVGVMAYFLLSGVLPFTGRNECILFANITCGRFKFDTAVWKGISEQAKDFISKLILLDPERRLTVEGSVKA
ncbi:kinase-like domain-containing protein [Obelidium mucronatum]|nr:kinase-like domain-containing protein [Obelidium mucronatum]